MAVSRKELYVTYFIKMMIILYFFSEIKVFLFLYSLILSRHITQDNRDTGLLLGCYCGMASIIGSCIQFCLLILRFITRTNRFLLIYPRAREVSENI